VEPPADELATVPPSLHAAYRALHSRLHSRLEHLQLVVDDRAPDELRFRLLLLRSGAGEVVDEGPDGNCMFRCFARQAMGDPRLHPEVRRLCARELLARAEEYEMYVDVGAGGWPAYVAKVRRPGEWGDSVELAALGNALGVAVVVFQKPAGEIRFDTRQPGDARPVVRLSYHDRNHYNSVRAAPDDAPVSWPLLPDADDRVAAVRGELADEALAKQTAAEEAAADQPDSLDPAADLAEPAAEAPSQPAAPAEAPAAGKAAMVDVEPEEEQEENLFAAMGM
jgi:hypothetical protein